MENRLIHLLRPDSPTNLTASSTTATGTSLTWSAVSGASGYKVYRDDKVIASPTTTTYAVTGLITKTKYNFYVTAINAADTDADNESNPSNSVAVTTL